MNPRVLFVDDEVMVLGGIRRMLIKMRREWDMVFVESGKEALAQMAEQSFDVIVSDMRMPEMDGAELLRRVHREYPGTIRLVLSGQAERNAVMRCVGISHQYLAKPCDPEILRASIARACDLCDLLDRVSLGFVSSVQCLPVLPASLAGLMSELGRPKHSPQRIGQLVERDAGLASKVLQLVNTAFFGRPRVISSATEAVDRLGIETLCAILENSELLHLMGRASVGISLPAFAEHGWTTGTLARRILAAEGASEKEQDEAFTLGVLHDCGKLILAESLADEYSALLARAEDGRCRLFDLERESLAATHADVGAALLGLWGLPDSLVEIVSCHHQPRRYQGADHLVMAVLHAANAFAHTLSADDPSPDEYGLDMEYLAEVGFRDRLPRWSGCLSQVAGTEKLTKLA